MAIVEDLLTQPAVQRLAGYSAAIQIGGYIRAVSYDRYVLTASIGGSNARSVDHVYYDWREAGLISALTTFIREMAYVTLKDQRN